VNTPLPGRSAIPIPGVRSTRIPSVIVVCGEPETLTTLAGQLKPICSELIECRSLEEGMKRLAPLTETVPLVVGPASGSGNGSQVPSADPSGEGSAGGLESEIIGKSAVMEAVRQMVLRVAPSMGTVFLTGEPGSGRTHVARALHEASGRGNLPLVIVECGAESEAFLEKLLFGASEGRLAEAEADVGLLGSTGVGTLFLGDIEESPLAIQRKLLQAIENQGYFSTPGSRLTPLRVRLIASARPKPSLPEGEGRFLPELRDRLGLLEIPIPPLRERLEDLPELARHLVNRLSRTHHRAAAELDPGAERILVAHSWPWNVRELRNVLERAFILLEGQVIRESDLPRLTPVRPSPGVEDLAVAREQFERHHIEQILGRYGGDKHKAAKAMGVDVSTLYRKMRRSG